MTLYQGKSSKDPSMAPRASSSMRGRDFFSSLFGDEEEEKKAAPSEKPAIGRLEPPPARHAQFLSDALRSKEDVQGPPIDQDRTRPIPQQIHRFWTGGPMSDAAVQVLVESAEKTKMTQWKNNLWYSSSFEEEFDNSKRKEVDIEKRTRQRKQLSDLGYNIRAIEDLADEEPTSGFFESFFGNAQPQRRSGSLTKGDLKTAAKKAMGTLNSGSWDDVKHLSDVARLMYLYKVGGHHFDVDMGLGEMDLTRSYFHNDPEGRVPLMGAFTVTGEDDIAKNDLAEVSAGNLGAAQDPKSPGARVANQAKDMTGFLNGMIASRPQNPNITAAIDVLYPDIINGSNLSSGMVANSALLFGPERKAEEMNAKEKDWKRKLAVPPYLFELEHLTPEVKNRK